MFVKSRGKARNGAFADTNAAFMGLVRGVISTLPVITFSVPKKRPAPQMPLEIVSLIARQLDLARYRKEESNEDKSYQIAMALMGVCDASCLYPKEIETLQNMCLVSRGWCEMVRPRLFSRLFMRCEAFDRFQTNKERASSQLALLCLRPRFAEMLRDVTVIAEAKDLKAAWPILLTCINVTSLTLSTGIMTAEWLDMIEVFLQKYLNLRILVLHHEEKPIILAPDLHHPRPTISPTSVRSQLTTLDLRMSSNCIARLLGLLSQSPTRASLRTLQCTMHIFPQFAHQYLYLLELLARFDGLRELAWHAAVAYSSSVLNDIVTANDITLPSLLLLEKLSLDAAETLQLFRFVQAALRDAHVPSLKTLVLRMVHEKLTPGPIIQLPTPLGPPQIVPHALMSQLTSITLDWESLGGEALYRKWSHIVEPFIERHHPGFPFSKLLMLASDTPEEGIPFEAWIREHPEVTTTQLELVSLREWVKQPKIQARLTAANSQSYTALLRQREALSQRASDRRIARLRHT